MSYYGHQFGEFLARLMSVVVVVDFFYVILVFSFINSNHDILSLLEKCFTPKIVRLSARN